MTGLWRGWTWWLCGGDAGYTVEVEIEKPKTLKALGVVMDESLALGALRLLYPHLSQPPSIKSLQMLRGLSGLNMGSKR